MGNGRARRRTRVMAAIVGTVAIGIGASACGSTANTASSRGASAEVGEAASDGLSADAGLAAPVAEGASLNTDALGQVVPPADRPVISTASLTVEADDVSGTKPRALAIVAAKDGYLFADESSYGKEATSVLTFKVPPASFGATLEDLGRLGELRSQQVSSEDVTDQVIDLQSRITAAEGSLARTGALLERATELPELRQLEDEFARRQVDLEKLRGQQKTLAARVDFATIVLTLHGVDDSTPALVPGEQAPPPGFTDGWAGGLAVATTVGTFALAGLGALLPFVPLALIAFALIKVLQWRSQRGHHGGAAVAAEG